MANDVHDQYRSQGPESRAVCDSSLPGSLTLIVGFLG